MTRPAPIPAGVPSNPARCWTPEVQLLVCLSRAHFGSAGAAMARCELAGDLDWSKFLDLAVDHDVAPLVFHQLINLAGAPVPLPVVDRMQRDLRAHAARGLQLAGELLRIARHLQKSNITVAAYKGIALARQLSGRQTLRQVSDLDILVPLAQVRQAQSLLVELGYRPRQAMTPAQEQTHLRTGCELALWSPDKRVQLEVHWNVAPAYLGISVERIGLWNRLQTLDWDGVRVAVPAPADLLLFLCVHGAKHRWQKLKWICDIHHLVHGTLQLDWPELLATAEKVGARRALLLGLWLARDLYASPLPGGVCTSMAADGRLARLSRAVYTSLFQYPRSPDGPLRSVAFQLATRDSAADQVRSALALLLQPNARDLGFRASLWPASLRRPLRLLAEHILGR